MNPPPDYPQPPSSSATSLRSFGFVLAHSEDEDDEMNLNLTQHERLEDFRRRIRRRTRRKLSSRRSSSYSSGTNSSDMEDISEDPEDNVRPVVTIRPACSEPSLVALSGEKIPDIKFFHISKSKKINKRSCQSVVYTTSHAKLSYFV